MNAKEFFNELVEKSFKTTTNAKGLLTIQQTERNNLRNASLNVFAEMLKLYIDKNGLEDDVKLFLTKAGLVVAVYNVELDQEICFELSPSIPALADNGTPYDVYEQASQYEQETIAKMKALEEKNAKKIAKAKKDAELREKMKEKKNEK